MCLADTSAQDADDSSQNGLEPEAIARRLVSSRITANREPPEANANHGAKNHAIDGADEDPTQRSPQLRQGKFSSA
jgi:hypothetical protein